MELFSQWIASMTLYTTWSSILLDWLALIFVWSSLPNVEGFEISKISLKTSNLPGSGMDQPSMSFFGFSDEDPSLWRSVVSQVKM